MTAAPPTPKLAPPSHLLSAFAPDGWILAASGDGEAFLQSGSREGLVRLLTNQDWVVGGDAARVFAQIGPETLPEVIKALEGVSKTDASAAESGAVGATRVW